MSEARENPFWEQVLADYIAFGRRYAETFTARVIAAYEKDYADVCRNWTDKGYKAEMPPVPRGVVFNEQSLQLEWYDIQDYPRVEPWEMSIEHPPVDFGPPIDGLAPTHYWVVGVIGQNGMIKVKDGQRYELIIRGSRGHPNFVRMWKPVA